jgi:hypothetical protein
LSEYKQQDQKGFEERYINDYIGMPEVLYNYYNGPFYLICAPPPIEGSGYPMERSGFSPYIFLEGS